MMGIDFQSSAFLDTFTVRAVSDSADHRLPGDPSWAIAAVLGFGLALMRESSIGVVRGASAAYVWFFRGIPLLLLVIFIYNAVPRPTAIASAAVEPIHRWPDRAGAQRTGYMAEVFRGGLQGVSNDQRDAGRALGFGYIAVRTCRDPSSGSTVDSCVGQ